MAKLTIAASYGPPERQKYSEIEVQEIGQRTLSFYLGCEVTDLERIAKERGIAKIEKVKANGSLGIYYSIDDFPTFVQEVQKSVMGEDRDFINSVDAASDQFEIKYASGSVIKFSKEQSLL